MLLRLEIFYYKFLGYFICFVPFPSLKSRLIDYANKRFPSVD